MSVPSGLFHQSPPVQIHKWSATNKHSFSKANNKESLEVPHQHYNINKDTASISGTEEYK